MMRQLTGLIVMLFAASFFAYGSAEKGEGAFVEAPSLQQDFSGKTVILPIHGVIIPNNKAIQLFLGGADAVIDERVIELIDKAEREEAKALVLDIDSPGGVVDSCEKICHRLIACKIPTTALVTKRAISGGSMVATACRRIVMVKGTTIGDCEPHAINQQLPDYMREKVESPIRARMRANAEANGYPGEILEAMVTKSIELYRVRFADGTREFIKRPQLDLLEKQILDKVLKKSIQEKHLVVQSGSLLTLTSDEALEYGLAGDVVDNVQAFLDGEGVSEEGVHTAAVGPQKGEGDGGLSTQLTLILLLCFIVGVAGVVVEANVPGFGVPGIIGIIGFSCFFTILFMNERATPMEIGLFVVGLSLLLVEIFILPGFGVAGGLGALCIVVSLVLGFLPAFDTRLWQNQSSQELDSMIYFFSAAFAVSVLTVILVVQYLEKIPLLKNFVLSRNLRSGRDILEEVHTTEGGETAHTILPKASELLGTVGVAETVLRPSGKMRTEDGRLLDVVSSGTMIGKGTRIAVAEVNGPRITIRSVEQDT